MEKKWTLFASAAWVILAWTFAERGAALDCGSLSSGEQPDCNQNGLPDDCDLLPLQPALVPARQMDVGLTRGTDLNDDSLATADLDGDGLADMAALDNVARGVRAYWSLGDGAFQEAFVVTSVKNQASILAGDWNGDGRVDISDAVYTLNWLFLGGAVPPCLDAADVDDSGEIDITDGHGVNVFLFLGGSPPPAPGPFACGGDPTPDALTCVEGGCSG